MSLRISPSLYMMRVANKGVFLLSSHQTPGMLSEAWPSCLPRTPNPYKSLLQGSLAGWLLLCRSVSWPETRGRRQTPSTVWLGSVLSLAAPALVTQTSPWAPLSLDNVSEEPNSLGAPSTEAGSVHSRSFLMVSVSKWPHHLLIGFSTISYSMCYYILSGFRLFQAYRF